MKSNLQKLRNIFRPRSEARARVRLLAPAAALVLTLEATNAHAYVGEQLLKYMANYFFAPLGLLALVGALAAAMVKPEFISRALWIAGTCSVLFFVLKNANQVMQLFQQQ